MHGRLIWADLSSFRPEITCEFYQRVLGWAFKDDIAFLGKHPVAGLFEMPEKFQQIGMPSFWMSYIQVDDIEATVARACELGGKVEIRPEPYGAEGVYALIRDPLGAGFSVYEGQYPDSENRGKGARLGHGFFVSDAGAVRDFYTGLFGWRFQPVNDGCEQIICTDTCIAYLHEIPDPGIRGKEEYWAVYFASANLSDDTVRVQKSGGEVVAKTCLPEGQAILVKDPDGGQFFLVQNQDKTTNDYTTKTVLPWKAVFGLALIVLSCMPGLQILWAVFMGYWIWTALRDGETWLFEPVRRKEYGVIFWLLIATYGILATSIFIGVV